LHPISCQKVRLACKLKKLSSRDGWDSRDPLIEPFNCIGQARHYSYLHNYGKKSWMDREMDSPYRLRVRAAVFPSSICLSVWCSPFLYPCSRALSSYRFQPAVPGTTTLSLSPGPQPSAVPEPVPEPVPKPVPISAAGRA
jgi:hypothetical protein